jgi:hypothetical protein
MLLGPADLVTSVVRKTSLNTLDEGSRLTRNDNVKRK